MQSLRDRTDLTVTVNAVAVALTGRCSGLVSHRGVDLAEYAQLRGQEDLILLGAVEPEDGPTRNTIIRAEVILAPRGREVDEKIAAPISRDVYVRQGDRHVEPDAWEEVIMTVTSKVIKEVFSDDELDLLQSMTPLTEMLEQTGIWDAHFSIPKVQGWDDERKPIFSLADHQELEKMRQILHGLVVEAARVSGDQDIIYQMIVACDTGQCPFDGDRLAEVRQMIGYPVAERHWSRKAVLGQELREFSNVLHGESASVIPVIIEGEETLIYTDGDHEVARSSPDEKVDTLAQLGWIEPVEV